MRKSIIALALFFGVSLQAGGGKLPAAATCADLLLNESLSAIVLENIARLQEFPGNKAMFVNQMMIELIGHFDHPALDFAYMERLFRKYNYPIHLIANSDPIDPVYTLGYTPALQKIKAGRSPRYWVWVCVYREAEATEMKARFGTTDEENMHRLEETGVLMVKNSAELDPEKVDIADEKTQEALSKAAKTRYPFRPEHN